jgi:hypothetical protein
MRALAQLRLLSLFTCLATAATLGCSSSSGASSKTGSEADGSTGHGDGSMTDPADPHVACNAYLNCASVVVPAELPGLQQGYGPTGSCWTSGLATTCEQACVSGLTQLISAGGTGKSQCGCVADANCAAGPGFACETNVNCPAPADHCDVASGGCVQCLQDADCPTSIPHCITATNTCVECASDSDCGDNANGHYCLISDGLCGPCGQSSDCPSGEACFWQSTSTMSHASFSCSSCSEESCGAGSTCTASGSGHPTCAFDSGDTTCLDALNCYNYDVPVDCLDDPSCCGGAMFPAAVCHENCIVAFPSGGPAQGDCSAKCGACN